MKDKITIQNLRNSGIPIYDNSTIRSYLWCPRGCYYRHELGLDIKNKQPNPAMMFGTAGHLALEYWYSVDHYKDDSYALRKFVESFTPYEEVPRLGKTGKELSTTYSCIFGCSLLQTYFDKYREDNRTVVDLENAYAEEIMEDTYLVGKIDKLVESSRGITFCDYKFTKYMNFLVHPNPQMCGYKFLIEKMTGESVTGEVDIVGVSKSKDPSELLSRIPIDYSSYSMQLWKESAVGNILSIERCRNEDFWPQSWDCKPFFRDCDYTALCTASSKQLAQELQERLYVQKFWDPFSSEV